MKYIFWVHSHTSFYNTIEVIKSEKIKSEDVVFLSARAYKNKYHKIKFIDVSVLTKLISVKNLLMPSKIYNEADLLLKKYIGDSNFLVFIPQISDPTFQIILTNPRCIGYHYVEEGLANYIESKYNNSIKKNFSTKVLLNVYNFFSSRLVLHHPFFGIYSKFRLESFKPKYFYLKSKYHYLKERVIDLEWTKHDIDFVFDENSCAILIVSPTYEYGLANIDKVKDNIEKQLEYLKLKEKKIYVKFHPKNDFFIKDFIMTRDDVIEINDNEPLEQIFLNYNNLFIVGLDSSLLFYAKILNENHKVVSFYKDLLINDSLYNEKCTIKPIQQIFDKVVCHNKL